MRPPTSRPAAADLIDDDLYDALERREAAKDEEYRRNDGVKRQQQFRDDNLDRFTEFRKMKTLIILAAMFFLAEGSINQERSLLAALAKNLRGA